MRADDGTDYHRMLEPIEVLPRIEATGPPGLEVSSPLTQADFVELEAPAQPNGMFGQFDRDAINEMIRVLRRARNAAFGADE